MLCARAADAALAASTLILALRRRRRLCLSGAAGSELWVRPDASMDLTHRSCHVQSAALTTAMKVFM